MSDIFDEVTEDLRADQAQAFLRRYGYAMLGLLALILAGVGFYEHWRNLRQAAAEAEAAQFLAATPRAINKDGSGDHALPLTQANIDALRAIAASGSPGYRSLARLRLAEADWAAGEHDLAISAWAAIAADPAVSADIHTVAALASVRHQLDTADEASLRAALQPLLTDGGAMRPLAEEDLALVALRFGKKDEAIKILRSLSKEQGAPQGLQHLAIDMLLILGALPPNSPVR